MIINPLSPDLIHLLTPRDGSGTTTGRVSKELSEDFGSILTNTFRQASESDAIDKKSGMEFLSGETDDFSGLLIDIQKADMALQLALEVRNKMVESYNRIIKMTT